MQRTQHTFASLIEIGIGAILALTAITQIQVQAQDKKADPTGTWTWTTPGRNGGPDRKNTLKLKLEGDKLTGKLSFPARQGQTADVEITDAKLKGDAISFTVAREFNGNKVTQKYQGKISDDAIKGKVEIERNDQTQSRDWEAKRETEKK